MVEPTKIPGLEEQGKNVYFMTYRDLSLPDKSENGLKIFRQALLKEIENAVKRGKRTFLIRGESIADLIFGDLVLSVKAGMEYNVRLIVCYVTAIRAEHSHSSYKDAWRELEGKADYVCVLYPEMVNQISKNYDHYMIHHVSEVICFMYPGRQRSSLIARLCAQYQIPLYNILADELFVNRFQQQSRNIQNALKRLITQANESKRHQDFDEQKTALREAMQEADNADDLKALAGQCFILEQKQKTSFQEFILSRGEEILNPDLIRKLKEFEKDMTEQ